VRGAFTVFGIWCLAYHAWWRPAPMNKRLRADNCQHQAEQSARRMSSATVVTSA
jgi:hypothetical protein